MGLHCRQHVLSQGLLLHLVGERLGHFVVDIGIEQGATDVFQRLRHIDLGDFAFTLKYFP